MTHPMYSVDAMVQANLARVPHVAAGLQEFAGKLCEFLGQRLMGLYLYGSLAGGCYNSKTSDVDVVAVLDRPIGQATKEALLEFQRTFSLPIDATYITVEQLNADFFPTSIQCVIRSGRLSCAPNGLIDFPVVRHDIYVNGAAIRGPAVRDMVRPVPTMLLRDCVMQLFPMVLEKFKNPVLMLCRICCTLVTGEPRTKAAAGEWLLQRCDARWRDLISHALQDYAQGTTQTYLPSDQALAFEAYCRNLAISP